MLHSWEDSHLDLTYKGPLSFRNRLLLQEAVTLLTFGWDCQLRKGFFSTYMVYYVREAII